MAKTRAIRFSDEEDYEIESFLAVNKFLDFSALARLAISSFVRKPSVEIRGLKSAKAGVRLRSKNV